MISKKIGILSIAVMLLMVVSVVSVNAEFWSCFSKGDDIDYCNPLVQDRSCGATLCQYCMHSYDEVEGCYNQGNYPVCLNLDQEDCIFGGGGAGEVDGEAPELTINYPEEGEVYTSRSTLLDLYLNEEADVYFLDNIHGRGRWSRVCSNCEDYSRKRSFKEGFNDLTFKAVDDNGNEAFVNKSFYIDSRAPRIRKTEPRRGFANGYFTAQIDELNPIELILNYGNLETGMREQIVDLDDCYEDRRKINCDTIVNLEDYDGEEIEYWFELEDMAGSVGVSRTLGLDVDTTYPILDNPESFWEQGEGRYSRYVYFEFNITEENLDGITYIDQSESRPRERRLCSRLRDGVCKSRKSFRRGDHALDIQITDEAGNSIGKRIEFNVDY